MSKTTRASKPRWDFVHEEEYPDAFGYNCNGVLSDGDPHHLLFFTICRDPEELIEHCSVRTTMYALDETELCRYPWTDENDEILLECLNRSGEYYGAECSPLRTQEFRQPSPDQLPEFAEATIVFKDTPEKREKVLFKLNPSPEKNDEQVFFYCQDFPEFLRLMQEDNGEDFEILCWNPMFRSQLKGF